MFRSGLQRFVFYALLAVAPAAFGQQADGPAPRALPVEPTIPPDPAAVEIEGVKLMRRFSAGQVFSYASVGRSYRQTVVSTKGAVVQEALNGMRCELAAALSIDSVRADGRPQEMSLRVFRLVVREGFMPKVVGGDDERSEPLVAGSEVTVRYPKLGAGAPELELLGDGKLSEVAKEALLLALPEAVTTRDDDEMFGKAGRVKVGETWKINGREVSLALAEGGIQVAPDHLEGDVKLVSAAEDGGDYQVSIGLRGLRAGVPLPEGYAVRSGILDAKLETTLPANPDLPPLAERSEYTLRSEAMGREGDSLMAVDMAFFQSKSARYLPVGGGS